MYIYNVYMLDVNVNANSNMKLRCGYLLTLKGAKAPRIYDKIIDRRRKWVKTNAGSLVLLHPLEARL